MPTVRPQWSTIRHRQSRQSAGTMLRCGTNFAVCLSQTFSAGACFGSLAARIQAIEECQSAVSSILNGRSDATTVAPPNTHSLYCLRSAL